MTGTGSGTVWRSAALTLNPDGRMGSNRENGNARENLGRGDGGSRSGSKLCFHQHNRRGAWRRDRDGGCSTPDKAADGDTADRAAPAIQQSRFASSAAEIRQSSESRNLDVPNRTEGLGAVVGRTPSGHPQGQAV